MTALEAEINASRTLIELATRLGHACLSDQNLLEDNLEKPAVQRTVDWIEELIAQTDPEAWQHAPRRGYASLLKSAKVEGLLWSLKSLHPVGHLAVLRGLCPGALDLFFKGFRGRLDLSKGVPIPFATRPVQTIFGDNTTPYQPSIAARMPLRETGFDLFGEVDPSVAVTVDFSFRDQLDAIAWPPNCLAKPSDDPPQPPNLLPRVGVIHSRLDEDRLDYKVSGRGVFWVGPKHWSLEETRDCLEAVRHAHIAVLPELSLPTPNALQREIEENHANYSPLIVAGSAHASVRVGGKPIRVNESRVYIEGKLAMRHRKIRGLETRHIGNQPFDEAIHEDLAPQHQITLLSGESTRLGVVICSDLVDRKIPWLLEECGVNLLLVPSLTYKTGPFAGNVGKLAAYNQGLSVVVNPILDKLTSQSQAPFTTIVAVPHSSANEQSCEYFLPPGRTEPYAFVLDPNQPLDAALRWD